MITAADQGAVVTIDGGRTWSSWYNQPTAQFYHLATDNQFPYWIYGSQQDSGAAATPSRTDYRSIMERDWKPIAVGGENDWIAPDPGDSNVIWGGRVTRFDRRTLQDQDVDPTLAYPGDGPYRSEWTLPLAISPGDGSNRKAIYFANQFLFRTVDDGKHWEKVSPDLTRENPGVPGNLDPVTAETSAWKGPRRGVIYSIALTPLADGQIWCGTDDGLIWLSRDDGKNWTNVTPKDLTAWSKVAIIEASHFDAETAYAAIDRHRLDDLTASILRTRDGGKTWSEIARGIPDGSFVNVVREDPVRRGLLYAGTETGVFVSFDDGDHWQPLRMNLPNCSIRDIDVKHGDLVVATHGRSFWVLDDLSPLRQIDAVTKGSEASDFVLLTPRTAVRVHPAPFQGTPEPKDEPMGENPPRGAILDYYLKRAPSGPVLLEILDAKGATGTVVRRYASDDKPSAPDLQKIRTTPDWVSGAEPPSAAAGMHRFVWDLHDAVPDELAARTSSGLWAPPGRYSVRLIVGGKSVTQPLVVTRDPRLPSSVTDADLVRQHELSREIQAERVRVAAGLRQADALRKQIAALRQPGLAAALAAAIDRAAGPPVLVPGEEWFDTEEVDPTTLRRLAFTLSGFQSAVESADAAPTPDAVAGFAERRQMVAEGLARWSAVLATDLPKANASLGTLGLPPLTSD
jgi:photosystem II stability/assembly factor-like uncharacterized protein